MLATNTFDIFWFYIVSVKVSRCLFLVSRSVKVATFMFLVWYLFIIVPIILYTITAIIGADVCAVFSVHVTIT